MRSSRWQPRILIATLAATIIAALAVETARGEARFVTARSIASTTVATWVCQDQIPRPRTPSRYYPWKPHSQAFREAELGRWQQRLRDCRSFLKERARQWNWQAFPSHWIQLARCESSINWYAEGSSSDGTFYSAFNIGRTRYDGAAHKMGVRGWHEGPGVPSPYEQVMAAIGYVRLYGDGFTGRCHGIARTTWN